MSSRRPGMYADISDDQLRNLFSSDNWKNNLSYEQRMAACQEVENRLAEERGTEPRNVMSEHMDGTCYGYQSGYTIALNEEMMRDGTFSSTYIDEQGSPQTITVDPQFRSIEIEFSFILSARGLILLSSQMNFFTRASYRSIIRTGERKGARCASGRRRRGAAGSASR